MIWNYGKILKQNTKFDKIYTFIKVLKFNVDQKKWYIETSIFTLKKSWKIFHSKNPLYRKMKMMKKGLAILFINNLVGSY
jgi:uncharacterized protein YjbK